MHKVTKNKQNELNKRNKTIINYLVEWFNFCSNEIIWSMERTFVRYRDTLTRCGTLILWLFNQCSMYIRVVFYEVPEIFLAYSTYPTTVKIVNVQSLTNYIYA